jgi:hypothetical protein
MQKTIKAMALLNSTPLALLNCALKFSLAVPTFSSHGFIGLIFL